MFEEIRKLDLRTMGNREKWGKFALLTANVVLIVECRTFQTDFTKRFKLNFTLNQNTQKAE
jgi:hypothetical protein